MEVFLVSKVRQLWIWTIGHSVFTTICPLHVEVRSYFIHFYSMKFKQYSCQYADFCDCHWIYLFPEQAIPTDHYSFSSCYCTWSYCLGDLCTLAVTSWLEILEERIITMYMHLPVLLCILVWHIIVESRGTYLDLMQPVMGSSIRHIVNISWRWSSVIGHERSET